MEHRVVRNITRVAPELIAGLGTAGVATVHESQGRTGLLDPGVHPMQRGVKVAGPAVTVAGAPGDNIMLHAAIEVLQPGDVLVVSLSEPGTYGMFGDLLATSVRAHGGIGLVIDSAVRDIADLNAMGFPVWARAVHAQGSVKETPGSVNVPIHFGGTRIDPGDVVVADDDGVVIVPARTAPGVLEAANTRLAKEEDKRARLAAGELTLDTDGLREKLIDLGVQWVDSAEET